MIPLEDCRWLVKYQKLPSGGVIRILRFEEQVWFGVRVGRRQKQGLTLVLINDVSGEAEWHKRLAKSPSQLWYELVFILTCEFGSPLDYAEAKAADAMRQMQTALLQREAELNARVLAFEQRQQHQFRSIATRLFAG